MISVVTSGFYSTIQDDGRKGYQGYGVPYSGVMDRYSANLSNALLNNNLEAAVMEVTMTGPKLKFNIETLICITGADMSPMLNEHPVKVNQVIKVSVGDVLSFGRLQYGFRAYLAISGGFQTEEVLGSKSMYKGITKHFKINTGDQLQTVNTSTIVKESNSAIKVKTNRFLTGNIEVYKGPEFDNLSETQKKQLLTNQFSVSKDNNRMAYQLNEVVKNNLKPIITSLVMPGTIQLTPSGKLIVLMRDCQTTGGYPRVLQLKEASIDILAQKFTGNAIRFIMIEQNQIMV